MRVLLANSAYHPRLLGGAEFSTWALARGLSARGHEVHVLATTARRDEGPRDELTSRESEGLSGQVLEASAGGWQDLLLREDETRPGLLRRGLHQFSQIHDRRWRELTRQALERTRAQVLHTNNLVGLSLAPWHAAGDLGVPVVHTTRDVFLLCPRTTLLRSDESLCTGGPLPCQLLRGAKRLRTDPVSAVTAPSRFTLNRHREFGFFRGVPGHVVPNAFEGEIPDYCAPPEGEVRGVYLGALAGYKGVGILCQALESLIEGATAEAPGPRIHFDFAGDGPLRERVEALAARSDGRVRYHGVVYGDDKSALLRGAHFVVIPSLCEEAFGRAALDAYAHGRAVVASSRGALPEVVADGQTGWVIEPNVEVLSASLREVLSDVDEVLRRGRAGHERAADYTLERQAEEFERVYASAGV
jgi:glycosyltransferase involved in cell wall biosynthesis